MIAKLIIASLLAGTSTASVGQEAGRSAADGSTSQWPLLHQCTLTVSKLAIKTKGTNAQRGRVGDWDGDGWSRIDLHLAGSPGGSGGPTISAHAINTKGTGAAGRSIKEIGISVKSSRVSVRNQSPIGVDCVTTQVTGDEAAQQASMASFAFMRADGAGVGWSCSVSGSEDKPVFRVSLLVPTILGQGETPLGKLGWEWGEKNSRVSIVPRSAETSDSWHVACSSKEPRNTNYDLAVLKKA